MNIKILANLWLTNSVLKLLLFSKEITKQIKQEITSQSIFNIFNHLCFLKMFLRIITVVYYNESESELIQNVETLNSFNQEV
jgi:hypothetical protein